MGVGRPRTLSAPVRVSEHIPTLYPHFLEIARRIGMKSGLDGLTKALERSNGLNNEQYRKRKYNRRVDQISNPPKARGTVELTPLGTRSMNVGQSPDGQFQGKDTPGRSKLRSGKCVIGTTLFTVVVAIAFVLAFFLSRNDHSEPPTLESQGAIIPYSLLVDILSSEDEMSRVSVSRS